MAIYWDETFANLNNWTDYGNGHNHFITSAEAYSGSTSLAQPYPNGGHIDRFLGATHNQFNLRFAIKLSNGFKIRVEDGTKVIYIRADTSPGTQRPDGWLGFKFGSPQLTFELQNAFDDDDTRNLVLGIVVDTNWHEVEFEWILNTPGVANGSIRAFERRNGVWVQTFQQIDREYRGGAGASTFVNNVRLYGQLGEGIIYLDTLATGNSRIGATNIEEPQPQPVVLQSLSPLNASIPSSGTQEYVVTMSAPTPSPLVVACQSSNTAAATVPASATVNANTSTTLFTATAVATGSTTIQASYNGVSKTATLQVQSTQAGPGSDTTYTYSTQFSGTQGSNNWYYLEGNGTLLTYDADDEVWRGTQTDFLQTIWVSGFHPGFNADTKLRWVAPGNGAVEITGAAYDLDTAGGSGCTFLIEHNGAALFTRVIANGETTGGAYDVTATVNNGDFIEFRVTAANYANNSTNLNPVIVFTADDGTTSPPDEPPPIITVVDLFTASTTVVSGIAFTMTVRLSQTVTQNTPVVLSVTSVNLFTVPSSVTVLSGDSEADFTVTARSAGQGAIDAVLNGTKRVTMTVQQGQEEEPDEPPIDPVDPDSPGAPLLRIDSVLLDPDGARVLMTGNGLVLQFRFDAQPEWATVSGFQTGATDFRHVFTWPSGTTTVCYRLLTTGGIATAPTCVPFTPPTPPPPTPPILLAVKDKDGVEWQLRGKKKPYALYRNRTKQDGTFGLRLRKSSDGYMELFQFNETWIRREGQSWVLVT